MTTYPAATSMGFTVLYKGLFIRPCADSLYESGLLDSLFGLYRAATKKQL